MLEFHKVLVVVVVMVAVLVVPFISNTNQTNAIDFSNEMHCHVFIQRATL